MVNMSGEELNSILQELSAAELIRLMGREKLLEIVWDQVLFSSQVREILGSSSPLSRARLNELEHEGKLIPILRGKTNLYLRLDVEARKKEALKRRYYSSGKRREVT